MPFIIYIFSLCTFTFGMSEFVVLGLVSFMAEDLNTSVTAMGSIVATYALGAAIGAPFLTALVVTWRASTVLVLALCVLALGSLILAWIDFLLPIYLIRFVIGLAHGVFMAIASDVAVKMVNPIRAGRALSLVWVGLTLSLALGVPAGTFLGGSVSWRVIFAALGALGLFSLLGLLLLMPHQPQPIRSDQDKRRFAGIEAIVQKTLLLAAGVAMLVSVSTFSFFTYFSPFLLEVTQGNIKMLSLGMLMFGCCTILGNTGAGYAADRFGSNRCLVVALALLTGNLTLLWIFGSSLWSVLTLVGVLGALFFAIVTLSTLRLLALGKQLVPHATSVASGLSIAAFNLGTALGGGLGGWLIGQFGLVYTPLGGAASALLALVTQVAYGRHSLYIEKRSEAEESAKNPIV